MDMNVSSAFIVNTICVVVLIINMIRCYSKGFLLSLWECLGSFFAMFVAWNLSKVLAPVIMLYPKSWLPLQDSIFSNLLQVTINQYFIALIIFVAIKLILLILKPIVKMLQEIPIIKEINQFIGVFFGVAITWLWCIIAIFILSMPIIPEGVQLIDESLLKPVQIGSVHFLKQAEQLVMQNEIMTRIINGDVLSEQDIEEIQKLALEYKLDEIKLDEIIR